MLEGDVPAGNAFLEEGDGPRSRAFRRPLWRTPKGTRESGDGSPHSKDVRIERDMKWGNRPGCRSQAERDACATLSGSPGALIADNAYPASASAE